MIWKVQPKINQDFINSYPELNEITLQLLFNRNLKEEKEIEEFLNPNYEEHLLDPYLFKDMKIAIERFTQAIFNHEKILIYGDYDADGVCSTSALYLTIKALGGDVDTYLLEKERATV